MEFIDTPQNEVINDQEIKAFVKEVESDSSSPSFCTHAHYPNRRLKSIANIIFCLPNLESIVCKFQPCGIKFSVK